MHRLAVLALLLPATAAGQAPGVRVPDGFEVVEVADGALSNDIFCLCLDPQGRPVVSGRGYVRLLTEPDDRGRYTKALDFAGAPKDGAMGLLWEGDDLYCVGDGGLRVWQDAGGKGRERPPELLFPLKTGGEHDAHAVRRGPDGWLYLLCGNNAGISAKHASLPTSPVKDPIAGCVLRLPPDLKGCEVVAHGFRNPYGFDFNSDGELFTFDSDNERCVALPWYEGCRLYHVVEGGFHGWLAPQRAQTWRLPPYFVDVVPPVLDLGRGSPTGVVCYRHAQFPEKYRGGLFLCDWTFGKIWFVKLDKAGSSYTGKAEPFLSARGDSGLAPTAAAVDPVTGDLVFSIGGRGTRGAVYRVRYPEGLKTLSKEEVARRQPAPRRLEWAGTAKQWVEKAAAPDLFERRRALEQVRRHAEKFKADQIRHVVAANWDQPDRLVQQATARLLDRLSADNLARLPRDAGPAAKVTQGLSRGGSFWPLFADARLPRSARLASVRLWQMALGDVGGAKAKGTVWEGYTRLGGREVLPDTARDELRAAFPTGDADIDRELSRALAMIEDDGPDLPAKVAARLTADSSPIEDVHYLIVLARLKAARPKEVTDATAAALLALDAKLTKAKQNRDSNWPLRLAEVHAELVKKDPALNAALLGHADFGRPDHALWCRAAGFDRAAAAEKFLARSKGPGFAWSAELVGVVAALPAERALPVLRGLWGEHGLDEAILPHLARHGAAEDRARFRASLSSARLDTVGLCVAALDRLGDRADADELLDLVLALRRLPSGKEAEPLRGKLVARLQRATGQKLADVDAWAQWYVKAHPDRAAKLADADGVDVAAWSKRLAAVDWGAGDSGRGRGVFVKASCATCHSGVQALGPDLAGVAARFSRADLFTAIVQPSKDVAPRYRTTLLTTTEGKSYQGLIVYEATDGVILQTGPAETVRVPGEKIAGRRLTALSLMPAGLLDRLSDQEIADLYAYLKGLGAKN
jgi:putative heme-binding domain-containing protein